MCVSIQGINHLNVIPVMHNSHKVLILRSMSKSTRNNPYKCDTCGAQFSQSDSLKSHVHIHTGNKPYKCDICGAQFSRSDSLKSHVHIHTGKSCDFKKHVCIHNEDKLQMCAQFSQSRYLKTHVYIHTGTLQL